MSNRFQNALFDHLKKNYQEIINHLIKKNYKFTNLPIDFKAKKNVGEAFTLSFPIQGILKYHGLINEKQRLSYFPSISLNNGCGYTVSYLKFDKNLNQDQVFLNGSQIFGDGLDRVNLALDLIRDYSKIDSKAILISRNFLKSVKENEIGKGLGTSASGSSALALAAISIIYNGDSNIINNQRLVSIFSRFLSGSGCRSAVGGFSLWLTHPRINPLESYAIRLDRKEHQSFIDKISLLTIPIKSDLKTYQAHKIAIKSPFFQNWAKIRKDLVFDFIDALDKHNLNKIGELAEYDTLCLHSITMTAPNNQNIIAWTPITLEIMHRIRELRLKGYNVYFSIDTGPSLVLLTYKDEKNEIIAELKPIIKNHDIIEGEIEGPCKILNPKSPEARKLEKDIINFNIN